VGALKLFKMRIAWRQVSPGRGDAPGTKVLKLFIDT